MSIWSRLGGIVRRTGQSVEFLGRTLQGSYAIVDKVSNHETLQTYKGEKPALGPGIFIAPNASVIGNVTIGQRSSIWYGAVLRGDVNRILIGENSTILDGVIVHVAKHNPQGREAPTVIGNNVTIGHGATLHAVTVEDGSLVGMGAILLDGVKVQNGAIVAAGAVVPPGKIVPTGEVWGGSPAKLIRRLEYDEADFIIKSANTYAALAAVHAAENAKTFEEILVDIDRREDARLRDPDYDSHLGLQRDPVTREVVVQASHT
eukprot:jgi/Botrbrau1/2048/Bobra.0047s0024.2